MVSREKLDKFSTCCQAIYYLGFGDGYDIGYDDARNKIISMLDEEKNFGKMLERISENPDKFVTDLIDYKRSFSDPDAVFKGHL